MSRPYFCETTMAGSAWVDGYDYDYDYDYNHNHNHNYNYDFDDHGRCAPSWFPVLQSPVWSSLADQLATISIEDVLRSLLFLSVVVFLCTALLLQGTLLELGLIRCRRTMERWNRMLQRTSQRLPTLECHGVLTGAFSRKR